eukprot:5701357-Prymnesium_polylepis.1
MSSNITPALRPHASTQLYCDADCEDRWARRRQQAKGQPAHRHRAPDAGAHEHGARTGPGLKLPQWGA